MPIKTKSIVLTCGWATRESGEHSNFYRVEQVTDAVDPVPGAFLSPAQAKEYCDDRYWKVTIKPQGGR
jgi:hypothetical protein